MVTSLVTAVGLAGESLRVPIAAVSAMYGERCGRVGWMMARIWSVMLCKAWVRVMLSSMTDEICVCKG